MLGLVAWRGDRWRDVVARARSARPREVAAPERKDAEALAARAQRWSFAEARVAVDEEGLELGAGLESVRLAFGQLYHLEPIDPWPSLALGWVDRLEAYACVLSPPEREAERFARAVEAAVAICAERAPLATSAGWLAAPIRAWEAASELPGERPALHMEGYRTAPVAPDPIVAERTTAAGQASLLTWIWARLCPVPRRVDPKKIVLTKRYVYVRTRSGLPLRIDAASLRTMRKTEDGDAVYVFGRNTELLVVHQPDCPLAAALEARAAR